MLKSILFNRAHVLILQKMNTGFSVSTFWSLFFTYSMVRFRTFSTNTLHRRKRLAKPVWRCCERYQASEFLREELTAKRKDFHTIFAEHACFSQPQFLESAQKSASSWQNVQTVVAERLLKLEPSVLSSKVLFQTRPSLKNSITT